MKTEEKTGINTVELEESGVLSIPRVLLSAAGIPTDGNLVIETVPGVILIGPNDPVRMVCRPLMEVFEQLGIAEKEVEAMTGREEGLDEQTDL